MLFIIGRWVPAFGSFLLLVAIAGSASAQMSPTTVAPPASSPVPPLSPSSPPADPAPIIKGPSFQSGGLKLTVVSANSSNRTIALSLVLTNVASKDIEIAIVGPPVAANAGNPFRGSLVGGVASCSLDETNRSAQIERCLTAAKPELTPQQFTLIEHANAVPLTMTLVGGPPVDATKPMSFSMNVAVMKDDPNSGSDTLSDAGAAKRPGALPAGLRFITLGIPALSFTAP